MSRRWPIVLLYVAYACVLLAYAAGMCCMCLRNAGPGIAAMHCSSAQLRPMGRCILHVLFVCVVEVVWFCLLVVLSAAAHVGFSARLCANDTQPTQAY